MVEIWRALENECPRVNLKGPSFWNLVSWTVAVGSVTEADVPRNFILAEFESPRNRASARPYFVFKSRLIFSLLCTFLGRMQPQSVHMVNSALILQCFHYNCTYLDHYCVLICKQLQGLS